MSRAEKIRLDLIGQKFGELTVVEFSHISKHQKTMWKCKCDCGTEIIVQGSHLKSGHTTSCGKHKEPTVEHGLTNTRLYRIWASMKTRCTNQKNKNFHQYGGRGINICDEWLNDFETFYNWAMATGYNDLLTLERIDNNSDYCPSNCKWISIQEQQNNKRTSRFIEAYGEKHTVAEWGKKLGLNPGTIRTRLRAGDTGEKALRPVEKGA